jgi:MFS transporter, OFA family, oxalate/formate antiporter
VTETISISKPVAIPASDQRWVHLILAIICMVMIANLQYGWSIFVPPLQKAHGWDLAGIQLAFTVFVALETWATPVNGLITDRLGPQIGPRVVMGVGGILIALGWVLDSYANSLAVLYVGGALSGLGAGAIYSSAVGVAVKWFTDRRGLAVGLVAGGFGAGAALTIIPIQMVIASSGYGAAFFWAGLIQGGVVLIVSQFIRNPAPGEAPVARAKAINHTSARQYTPSEVVRSRVFWLLYILDVLMCAGGLMVTAYLAPIANAFQVSNTVAFAGATTLSVALVFANITNGIARPLFGWISDRIGNSETMIIAFALGAASYFLLSVTGSNPVGFIVCVSLIFFCWGNIFSLFPVMCTNLFGEKYATTNAAMLYTAKGAAGFLIPLGGLAASVSGNWNEVLYITTGINILAVLLTITVLRPAVLRQQKECRG